MITKRNGNGQTVCKGCKEKGKFGLTWDSFLYNFNDEPYCFDCLMEKLEYLLQENNYLKLNNPEQNIEHFRIIEENRRKINVLRKENTNLKEEIKGYQAMYFDKVMIINKAIEYIEKSDGESLSFYDITAFYDLLEILKGENKC